MVSDKGLSAPTQIIYGGTFDPPHEGHSLVLRRARELFPSAQLRVIPAAAPAGAHGSHKVPRASFADRLRMCQLQFESERVMVDPVEARLPAPNYTVQTLERLAAEQPGEIWAFLMGKDQLMSFAAWREPKAILERSSLIIIDREGGKDIPLVLLDLAQELSIKLMPLGAGVWQWKGLSQGVYSLGGAVSPAASRLIRAAKKKGGAADASAEVDAWLHPAVLTYIKTQGLYS